MIPKQALRARAAPRERFPTSRWSRRWAVLAVAFVLVELTAPKSFTDTPSVFAIKDARIVSVAGPIIEKGTVVIRDGMIEAVAAGAAIPEDAQVIDGAGLTVYPGLFDCLTDLGIEEPPAAGAARGGPPGAAAPAAPPERVSMLPHVRVADSLTTGGTKLENARNAGITTVLSAPRRGVFAGQSALINLTGEQPAQMVVKPSVALHIQTEAGGGFGAGYPGSLMGMLAYIKQGFMDADHYAAANAIYGAQKRGVMRPEYNRSLEALQPFARGQQPVVLTANSPKEIERAIQLAESLHLKYILSGAQEGYKVAALLKQKNVPVLVSLKFPEKDRDADPDADEPLRELKLRAEAPGSAAALQRAGVKFAFHSGQMSNPKDYLKNAAKAIQAGLSKDAALRAMTLSAAEIFGVADQLGSIEKGKIANLVVANGDLFSEKTQLRYVFVDGRKFEPKAEEPKKPEAGTPTGPTEPVDASGTWNLQLETQQGSMSVTAALLQQNHRVSGTITSDMGQADILTGSVSGKEVRFNISFEMNGRQLEVEFVGTIEGNTIAGSANSLAFGSLPFSGSKSPRQEGENS